MLKLNQIAFNVIQLNKTSNCRSIKKGHDTFVISPHSFGFPGVAPICTILVTMSSRAANVG